ncbi:hypothetical protein FQA39_LY17776 [Lamprigera yunnana]|nr:hypothetical protein FQA39_LY17776 [Lamprigera yunnana]
MILKITLLFALTVLKVNSQENAENYVAPALLECYNSTEILNREIRLPSSINVLIALLQKIESGPSKQNDRELAVELIHRFKQDGIVKTSTESNSPYVKPYGVLGVQADKNKIMLRKLIPGTAQNFPNSTLTIIERCSMHFMLSNAFELQIRGDENSVCNKLDRFQRRVRRTASNDDVEVFIPVNLRSRIGNLEDIDHLDPNKEVDVMNPNSAKNSVTLQFSECPLENGVVYTRWGAVQAGVIIAGIAAGRETQLLKIDNYEVDSRFAVTLAGDLAEVALHQGAALKDSLTVGAKGGWNGTQVPRWYFVERNSDIQMTDAEIRGGLDALILAKNIEGWKTKAGSIKLSQVLDMYYSTRGVFSKKYRACNRQSIYYEVAPQDELLKNTISFSFLLNKEAKLLGSITPEGINAYSEKVVDKINDYISSLQDLRCEIDVDIIERVNVDLLIVLDTDIDFDLIQRSLGYLFDNIDVNPYESNYTIINAKTAEIILNSSNSILDFYLNYNKSEHLNSQQRGFDVTAVFDKIEQIFKDKLNNETNDKNIRGKSTSVLFVVNTLSNNDKLVADSRKEYIKQWLPDLKLLVLGKNDKDAYRELVFDAANDVFQLSNSLDGTSVTQSVNQVIERIKRIPKRISNPKCGADLSGESTPESFDQFIEPSSINYYRVAPNYLFGEGEKSVQFQGYGYGNLQVCFSRQTEKPDQNNTSQDNKCETISGNNVVTFSLNDACSGYDAISSCPPAYFSVKSTVVGEESTNIRCKESGCRYPDSVKYTIKADKLSCHSSGFTIITNFVLLLTTTVTVNFILY